MGRKTVDGQGLDKFKMGLDQVQGLLFIFIIAVKLVNYLLASVRRKASSFLCW